MTVSHVTLCTNSKEIHGKHSCGDHSSVRTPMFGLLPGVLSARSRISLRLMSQPREQCYAWPDTPGTSDVNKETCLKILGG
jgi:hypothetical protein